MATSTLQRSTRFPVDRDLPEAGGLLAGEGAGRVARFLQEQGVDPHRVDPAQAHYRPGRWLAICYRTSGVERSSGRPVSLTVTVEHRAGEADRTWSFPDDPSLPGLPAAAHGLTVARRLRSRPGAVDVEPLRYRPRRRAVFRYRLADGKTLFGKVVTPARSRRMLALADALGGACGERAAPVGLRLALPVGRIAPGALVLPGAPGVPLRDLLLAGGPLPPAERLARLPADIHQVCEPALTGAGACAGLRAGRRFDPVVALVAARMVARLLPAEAAAAGRLAEAVIACAEASEPPDDRVVHGDLYENQVLVDGDHLTLIDLDDLGPGDPLLDAANFCAHLLLLATSGAPTAAVIRRYRAELQAASARAFDVSLADLAWREAYCLLRLVSGPFRILHPEWPTRMATRLSLAAEALGARRG